MRRFWILFSLLAALRFAQWGANVTADEYITLNFANQPASIIRMSYDIPNNHILLNLIVHAIDEVSPQKILFTPASLRPVQFPSILASIATLPLVYSLGAMLFNPAAGLLSMTLLGTSYWHLIYSHMIRGYSLSTFFNFLNIWILARALHRNRLRLLWILPFTLAAAHYLIPVNAYFSLALLPWVIDKTRVSRKAFLIELAFIAGFALTVILYLPILTDLMRESQMNALSFLDSLRATPARINDVLTVIGSNWAYRLIYLAAVGAGIAGIVREKKDREALWLCCGFIAIPPLLLTLQGRVAFARVFVTTLPVWSLLCAYGLQVLAAGSRRSSAVLIAVVLLPAAPEVYAFVSWNRGYDLRPPRNKALELVKNEDNFVLIFPKLNRSPVFRDEMSWEYYAYSGNLRPYEHAMLQHDYPFLNRNKYLMIARDAAEARGMLEQSGVSSVLIDAMRSEGRFGRWELFSATAGENPRAASDERKAHYMRGLKQYLAFNDKEAIKEFSWVVANDKSNIYAPLFYADCLADLGKTAEANRRYGWYLPPGNPAAAWFLTSRAQAALAHALGGEGRTTSPQALIERGSYERALAQLKSMDPTFENLILSAQAEANLRNYHRAYEFLAQADRLSPNSEIEIQMADLLRKKYAVPEAEELISRVVSRHPSDGRAREMAGLIGRLPRP